LGASAEGAAVIIDAHCHAGKGDSLTGRWDTDAPLQPYLSRARAAGIARTVVFPTFHSNYAEANANLARIIAHHPRQLIGFAMVNTRKDRGRIANIVGRAFSNVFADTSGVRRSDYLVQAVERAGAPKLLFGSDGPWLHPGLELYKIRLLELQPWDERLILGRNAWRLLLLRALAPLSHRVHAGRLPNRTGW